MNPLIFEGAGWGKASSSSDVGNCRIRTRIRNNAGTVIYLEIIGVQASKYTPKNCNRYPINGHVSHCFSKDCNEHSDWRKHEREAVIDYTAKGLLWWVNENLGCSFDSLQVVNEGLEVHETEQPLCESQAMTAL